MSELHHTNAEIERIRRVSDQLCSAHSSLSERYARRALLLDLSVLLLSAWITAMAFVDPEIAVHLTPLGLSSILWIGLLSVAAFALTLVQLRTDWKGLSEAHARSFGMYAEVKREAGYLLASSQGKVPAKEFQRLASRYDMASDVGVGVPEAEFIKQKRRHKMKVTISKILDDRPGAIPIVEHTKLIIRDFRSGNS